VTRFGLAALIAGAAALTLGVVFDWIAFDLLGIGLLAVLLLALASVARPSQLDITREIQPPRVPKGAPAIALLTFANRGRRGVPVTVATQHFSAQNVRTVIPRLRGGERGSRAYRLPTTRRGIFDVEPVEIVRRDAFDFFHLSRRHAEAERIWVYPRVLGFRTLPTGQTRHLEGPSSDTAPQGSITFHRLREYVPGDDLRLVHWRSSAKAGTLMVKHNVDTSQPYTVVVFDQRPSLYTQATFEEAVDVTASVVVASATKKAPVELRLTDGAVLGGPRIRDITPLIDHLTGIDPDPAGSLQDLLLALRRTKGGTSLVVVTGRFDAADLQAMAALRRRFDRLVLISVDDEADAPVDFSGVRVIMAANAEAVAEAWNHLVPA
jgi:uncharacterized protein (DUF58 family)